MGAVLREQNALPYGSWIMTNLMAKDDVNNVGAGRAAKGANLVIRTIKMMQNDTFSIIFFIHCESNGISSPLGVYHHRRCISSAIGCVLFRNDDIQTFGLMIYRNKLRMIYNGKLLIFWLENGIMHLKR